MKISSPFFKIFLLVFVLLINGFIFAQDEEIEEEEIVEQYYDDTEKLKIDITELLVLLRSSNEEITLSDYEIVSLNNEPGKPNKQFFNKYELSPQKDETKKIYFYNCDFRLDEDDILIFKNWNTRRFNIIGCVFYNPVYFNNLNLMGDYPLLIQNCVFYDEIRLVNNDEADNGYIHIKDNDFSAPLHIDMGLSGLLIDKCRFNADSIKFLSNDNEKTQYQLEIGETAIESIELINNLMNNSGLNNIFSLNLGSATIGQLKMISNRMQTLNLSATEVSKSLLIDSLFVADYIGILNFDFPEKNTNVSWYNLTGEKFAIFEMELSGMIVPYQAKTDKQLSDNLMYSDLMSAYNKFNTLYHERGDITSANASYVEIKDIETRKQAFVQKINPSFNNFINYNLNIFLKLFSDYATNPGKSLIISLLVLVFFTVLYMLSFSEWDGMNYSLYLTQLNLLSKYIKTDKTVNEIYHRKKNPHNKDLEKLKLKYMRAGKKLPRILKLMGEPIHFLGKFRYDIIPNLIRLFNFQPRKWESLGTGEKIGSGFLILIISLSYILYILVVKFINSLILSLNSFVVIGFGSLPEKGLAMYLSIIEGIIGWFLLTIFTITLLSQVLQSA